MGLQLSESEHVFDLPANAAAAGLARRELARTPGIVGDVAYKALLMASELIAVYIADVVPDPAAHLRLSVRVSPERVRIEVGGRTPPASLDALLHSRETPSLGGMGLQIVERMADRWGVAGEQGTAMWFELERATP